MLTPEQAPAGTKRGSNLLRSSRWKAKLLADWLWQQADVRVQALRASDEEPLLNVLGLATSVLALFPERFTTSFRRRDVERGRQKREQRLSLVFSSEVPIRPAVFPTQAHYSPGAPEKAE
jgi:hypothetical protein